MADADPLRLDKHLCFAVYAAGHAFTRFYRDKLAALDLTYPQYLVFLVLWEEDGLTVKGLGERLFLDSGTVTPLLKRLEARGLIERRRDEEDERLVRIYLTAQGRALRSRAMAIPLSMAKLPGGEEEDIDRLRGELVQLRDRLLGAEAGKG